MTELDGPPDFAAPEMGVPRLVEVRRESQSLLQCRAAVSLTRQHAAAAAAACTGGKSCRRLLTHLFIPLPASLPLQVWNVELEEAPVAMALSPKQQLLAVGTVDDAIAGGWVDGCRAGPRRQAAAAGAAARHTSSQYPSVTPARCCRALPPQCWTWAAARRRTRWRGTAAAPTAWRSFRATGDAAPHCPAAAHLKGIEGSSSLAAWQLPCAWLPPPGLLASAPTCRHAAAAW